MVTDFVAILHGPFARALHQEGAITEEGVFTHAIHIFEGGATSHQIVSIVTDCAVIEVLLIL